MGITQQIGASSLIKPGVIDNTAARPASPYEGQMVYQKDTDQLLVWNGTAWYPTSGVNRNVLIGKSTRTTSATTAGGVGTNIFTNSISFTADGSSVYRVEMFAQYVTITSSIEDMAVTLKDGSSTTATIGYYNGAFYIPVTIKYEWTPSAGSHSMNIALVKSGANNQTIFGSTTNPITLNVYGPDLS